MSSFRDALQTAHELTHVVQQSGGIQAKHTQNIPSLQQKRSVYAKREPTLSRKASNSSSSTIQNEVGDVSNLKSLRFAGDPDLEACYADKARLTLNNMGKPGTQKIQSGLGVRKVKEALVDLGYLREPADEDYTQATWDAVKVLKRSKSLGWEDMGDVGPATIDWLDRYFQTGSPTSPNTDQPPEPETPPVDQNQLPNTTASVNIQPHIRSISTPAGIAVDRIPPRVDTPISISLDGTPNPLAPIFLSIAGANGSNGTATINGAAKLALTGTQTVNLKGVAQTKPGNAGNLRLVARQGKTELASSSGFSVSAIPQDVSCDFPKEVDTEYLGYRALMLWKSDSGNTSDLNEVRVTESIQTVRQSGCLGNLGMNHSNGNFPQGSGARGAASDEHSIPKAALIGSGFLLAKQLYVFRDDRTNSERTIPIGNSGFQITHRAIGADDEKSSFLVTEKKGVSTTVQDSVLGQAFSSNAGEGFIELPQIV